jgi:hypothetical protein
MSTYWTSDQEFKMIGPGLNAWNMRSQDWLDESRVWKGGGDETIKLRPHVRRDLPGFLAADLLGEFLVEFRVPQGWDGGIPRPAVLVHRFEDGHSYLMHSNSGSLDLVAGDSFGDADPGSSPISPFSTFRRVDVLSIDAPGEEATLRIRCYKPIGPPFVEWAIDPMYLILSGSAYLRWVQQHYPHVPKVADIVAVLQRVSPDEQKATLNRAKTLVEYGKAIEEAFTKIRQ